MDRVVASSSSTVLKTLVESHKIRASFYSFPISSNPNSKSLSFFSHHFPSQMSLIHSVRSDNNGVPVAVSEETLRIGEVKRITKETNVYVKIDLDGTGICDCSTGIPFLDHMLDATGDIHIDDHHTNEDIALAIGTALQQALGDRKGIQRFGNLTAPLDEAAVEVVLDLSGRPHLSYDLCIPTERVGTYDTQLVEHFFQSLVNNSGMTLHISQRAGKNSHHIIEATFKAFARALRQATEYDPRRRGTVPSSKGVLSRA